MIDPKKAAYFKRVISALVALLGSEFVRELATNRRKRRSWMNYHLIPWCAGMEDHLKRRLLVKLRKSKGP